MQRTRRTHRNLLFRILLLALAILSGCASAKVSDLKDFTSDGCSLFPDGTIRDRAKSVYGSLPCTPQLFNHANDK